MKLIGPERNKKKKTFKYQLFYSSEISWILMSRGHLYVTIATSTVYLVMRWISYGPFYFCG